MTMTTQPRMMRSLVVDAIPANPRRDTVYWLAGIPYVGGQTVAASASISFGLSITVTNWSQVQAAHDTIKAQGYGTIVFDPAYVFTVGAGQGVNIDTYYVGALGNYAVIDYSTMANGEAAFTFYGSHVGHQFTGYADRGGNREFKDFYLYGGNPVTRPYSTDTQNTVTAFRFNSTTTGTSNQCQMINCKHIGGWKAWDVRSASYVVRVIGGRTTRTRFAANMDSDPTNLIQDWAEIFCFRDHLFAENGLQLYDGKGNHWRFETCHFDYHIDRVMDIKGAHVICTNCHFEWNTGDTAGDTLCPFLFTSAGSQLHIIEGKMVYVDKSGTSLYQPYYAGIFDMSDNSQVLIIENVIPIGLGRRTETTSQDAAVYVSAAGIVTPFVSIKWKQQNFTNLNDIPSMTMVQDLVAGSMIGGCLRDSGAAFTELGWRTVCTGNAASSAADAGNTGNGTLGSLTASNVRTGVYVLTILSARANAGFFQILSPDGLITTGTVGTAYNLNGLAFTLADGSTDFVAGDRFTITVTGAVISSVTVDENGVTRKNGRGMMKITGQGKVTITFPSWERNRRHAWQFFTMQSTATSIFAGTVTIRERQGGFGKKFDGSVVTFSPDSRGAQYSGTTLAITAVSATPRRVNWKNTTDRMNPRLPLNDAGCVPVEIDTTAMTAGAIYITDPSYDVC